MENKYLFKNKWKVILIICVVIALSFLDKIIPPFGIPIAVISILVIFKVRKIDFKHLGLFMPKSWALTIVVGLIVGLLIPALSIYVLSPIKEYLGIAQETPEIYQAIEGNNSKLIIYLIVSWTTAGFGEELIYRAFFIGQFSSVFKNSRHRWMLSLIISSIIFGLLHFNNGIDAIFATTIIGFILGLVYLKTSRNIWSVYIAHAVADTIAFLIIYSGLYKIL